MKRIIRSAVLRLCLTAILLPALAFVPVLARPAMAQAGRRVLAYGVKAQGRLGDLVPQTARALSVAMTRYSGVRVLGTRNVQTLADLRRDRALLSCADAACLQEIASALGADEFLVTTLVVGADGVVVSVERHDTRTGKSLGSEAHTWSGEPRFVAPLAGLLAITHYTDPSELEAGRLQLVPDVAATALVDGSSVGEATPEGLVVEVEPGVHEVSFEAEGFKARGSEIVVMPSQDLRVTQTLIESGAVATVWYESWWFWALVAGAAAGATVPFVVGGDDAPPTTSGPLSVTVPGP